MKLKPLRISVRSTGMTRTPAWPMTIDMPWRISVMGMQRGARAWRVVSEARLSRLGAMLATPCFLHHDAAVHFLVSDFDPFIVEADFGALVGGAIEAFGERAVHIGGR